MSSQAEAVADEPRGRASAGAAIAAMAVIAVIAVAIVVTWARLSAGNQAEPQAEGLQEPVPSTLVGGIAPGEVPGPVANLFDVPVVGAANLDQLPDEVMQQCSRTFGEIEWDDGQPVVEHAVATPDAIHASMIGTGDMPPEMGMGPDGDGPAKYRLSCSARHEGDGWIGEAGGFEPIFEGEEGGGVGMGGGYSCCDENGLATASATVEVAAGATWALQDRNGWFLAYPVQDRKFVTVTWKFREQRFGPGGPPQTGITFVDDQGGIIAEVFTGGHF